MQSTSWETLGWKKHKLKSRLPGEISTTSDMQMTPPYGRKSRRTKELLDESKRGEWKVGLNLNIQKTKIMAFGPITSWEIDRETVTDFIFLCSKITADGDCSHEIKRRLLLWRKPMTNLDSWPRGMGWRRRWEGGSGWGTHVPPWLIHVNVWQNHNILK